MALRLKKTLGGSPQSNLCLAVLLEAKKYDTKMWQDFKEACNITSLNQNSFEIALWVADWWKIDLAGEIEYDLQEPKAEEEQANKWKMDIMRCDTCGICIGEGFIETYPYPVGEKLICGWCLRLMKREGRIQVANRSRGTRDGSWFVKYLYPDGSIVKEKAVLMR